MATAGIAAVTAAIIAMAAVMSAVTTVRTCVIIAIMGTSTIADVTAVDIHMVTATTIVKAPKFITDKKHNV